MAKLVLFWATIKCTSRIALEVQKKQLMSNNKQYARVLDMPIGDLLSLVFPSLLSQSDVWETLCESFENSQNLIQPKKRGYLNSTLLQVAPHFDVEFFFKVQVVQFAGTHNKHFFLISSDLCEQFWNHIMQIQVSELLSSDKSEIQSLAQQLQVIQNTIPCFQIAHLSHQQQQWFVQVFTCLQQHVTFCQQFSFSIVPLGDPRSDWMEHVCLPSIASCLLQCEYILECHKLKRNLRCDLMLVWQHLQLCNDLFLERPSDFSMQLGTGCVGTVLLGQYSGSRKPVAVKHFDTNMPPHEIANAIFYNKYVTLFLFVNSLKISFIKIRWICQV